MDTIVSVIMIVLFLVLMVFIFSTALLTPIIGKRNLLFVIFLGFAVGAVGGAFFISPVMDDIPDMARAIYMSTEGDLETINVEISAEMNVQQFISDTEKIDGVKSVESEGILVKTDPIPNQWLSYVEERIPITNPNITSAKFTTNDTLKLVLKKGSRPVDVINNLKDWLMLTRGLNLRYSTVYIAVNVEASKVDEIIREISKNDVVIANVEGPVEDKIDNLKGILPNKSNVIIFCGFLGVIVGLAGIFVDSILDIIKKFKKRIRGKE
ncbi:MAG: hypothetical protein ACP5C3_00155 [Methanomicrobiales archaeon]